MHEKSLDKLIQVEWDTINELKQMLTDSSLSTYDKVRISNSLAFHAVALNKLLQNKGEKPLEDENLGSMLAKLPKKWRLTVLRDFQKWKRKSLLIV